MSKSASLFIPVTLIGVCLMAVFFTEFDRRSAGDGGSKGPRRYTVRTRFSLGPIQPAGLKGAALQEWLDAQVRVLSSRELLRSVVYRLSLDQYWRMSADAAIDRLKRHLSFELEWRSGTVTMFGWGDKLDDYLEITDAVRDTYEEYRNNEASETAARERRRPPGESSITVLEIAKEVRQGSR